MPPAGDSVTVPEPEPLVAVVRVQGAVTKFPLTVVLPFMTTEPGFVVPVMPPLKLEKT